MIPTVPRSTVFIVIVVDTEDTFIQIDIVIVIVLGGNFPSLVQKTTLRELKLISHSTQGSCVGIEQSVLSHHPKGRLKN